MIVASVALGGLLLAATGPQLLVVNSLSEDLSIIDTDTDAVAGTVPLGARGFQLALAPGGANAYITTTPGVIGKGQKPLPAGLAVFDLAKRQVTRRIPLAIAPLATIHLHPNGKVAYVVTAGEPGTRNVTRGSVLIVELASGKVTQRVPIGLNPLASAMTPNGGKLYTADWGSRSISVVDLTKGRLLDTIPLGVYPCRALSMRRDGTKVYAALDAGMPGQENSIVQYNARSYANNMNSQVAVAPPVEHDLLWEIDTAKGSVTKLPFAELSYVYALAIAPDGSHLYAYGRVTAAAQQQKADSYALLVYGVQEKRIVGRFGDFGFLASITVSADGSKLYLNGTPGDPATETAVQQRNESRVQSAQQSQQLVAQQADVQAIMQDLRQLRKTVTVLDARTGKQRKTIPVGSLPQGAVLVPAAKGK